MSSVDSCTRTHLMLEMVYGAQVLKKETACATAPPSHSNIDLSWSVWQTVFATLADISSDPNPSDSTPKTANNASDRSDGGQRDEQSEKPKGEHERSKSEPTIADPGRSKFKDVCCSTFILTEWKLSRHASARRRCTPELFLSRPCASRTTLTRAFSVCMQGLIS